MINKAGKQLTWLFALKILSRIFDLTLNVLVLRDLEPGIYGLTTNLDLLTNVTLFYLKIVLKQTYSRLKDPNQEQTQSAVNLMYFGLLITICIAPITVLVMSYNQSVAFAKTAFLYGISAIIDGASEPYAVQWVIQLKLNVVAKAEGLAVFMKTIVLYILLGKYTREFFQIETVVGFGIAQVIYSIFIFGYIFSLSTQSKFKQINKEGVYVVAEMKQVGYQFTLMAFMKFLLQELEKIVMVIYNNPIISGEFTLVSHIGSIIPRFIYVNIEQIAFNLFPKINQDEQSQLLEKYLKFLNLVGISIISAGIPCASAFLQIYGSQWTSDSCILAMQLYCVYIWIMGINGITESYVNSTIDTKDMWWYRYLLIAQTIIYSLSLIIMVQLGSSGIIISNILSMSVRIVVSFLIINKQGIKIQWNAIMPKFMILYLLGFLLQYLTEGFKLLVLTALYQGILGLINIKTVIEVIKSN
ncbi:unnamed protein product [Paramecium octaurelia]|uniref:Protein RFT1 homolog n=1 Tax=Paramecium octaurelia TaxID=43137 RepID=A0A8S1UCN9_PAROT|nr:unnamed protein product [Paramecium octaurelia]